MLSGKGVIKLRSPSKIKPLTFVGDTFLKCRESIEPRVGYHFFHKYGNINKQKLKKNWCVLVAICLGVPNVKVILNNSQRTDSHLYKFNGDHYHKQQDAICIKLPADLRHAYTRKC